MKNETDNSDEIAIGEGEVGRNRGWERGAKRRKGRRDIA